MKVYVVDQGCYSSYGVVDVYASLEAAIAAHPLPREARTKTASGEFYGVERAGGWRPVPSSPGSWTNGLDWDAAMGITEYELKGIVEVPMPGVS